MNSEARHELSLLEAFEQNGHVTQRGLSVKLGMALGLTNIYVKRLIRKGYVKCVNVQPNRLLYLITPTGIAEKTRLTYEFVDHSLKLYGQARSHLRAVLAMQVAQAHRRFIIYGTNEAAELAYISLRELGVEPVAILGEEPDRRFLGLHVLPLAQHSSIDFDLLIVATLEKAGPLVAHLLAAGVPAEKLCTLRADDSAGNHTDAAGRRARRTGTV